jgi:hypothetical protein
MMNHMLMADVVYPNASALKRFGICFSLVAQYVERVDPTGKTLDALKAGGIASCTTAVLVLL